MDIFVLDPKFRSSRLDSCFQLIFLWVKMVLFALSILPKKTGRK